MSVEQVMQLLFIIIALAGFSYATTFIVMGYVVPNIPIVLENTFIYITDKFTHNDDSIEIFCDVELEDDYQIYI